MNWYKFGDILNSIRLSVNMTQKELAEGICTQAQISKLENGHELPSSITIYQIAKKLGVDVEYFFKQIEFERFDYIEDVEFITRKHIRNKNYKELYEIVNNELDTPLVKGNKEYEQFLLWHQGICIYYIDSNKSKAIETLEKALNITRTKDYDFYNEREIEIINSIAIIYNEEGDFLTSLRFFDNAIYNIDKLPILKDFTIHLRLLYGASKTTLSMNLLNDSLKYCEVGIEICKKNESLYLLGELYYQKARCLKRLKETQAGAFFEKAIRIFNIEEKKEYEEVVREAYQEYKDELLVH
ncbi:helix-turn-helix domain-containing protein [Ornithinibacillus californiensis]|uniref:helix-turn-helix domain-containing protein n=1 Tax=Ornithinibacillus californiensis TaxID=161536 RepID=UPI00064E0215|nr:helix-turn-helix domain-containing protein [Ornithinibacillus californiensis]